MIFIINISSAYHIQNKNEFNTYAKEFGKLIQKLLEIKKIRVNLFDDKEIDNVEIAGYIGLKNAIRHLGDRDTQEMYNLIFSQILSLPLHSSTLIKDAIYSFDKNQQQIIYSKTLKNFATSRFLHVDDIHNYFAGLLNFRNAFLATNIKMPVYENGVYSSGCDLICYDNIDDVNNILYIPSLSDYKPRDEQTILDKFTLFEKTNLINHARTVYMHTSTHDYWCVDNMHDTKPHFEVFNSNKKHKGEACIYTGMIYTPKPDPKKYLN